MTPQKKHIYIATIVLFLRSELSSVPMTHAQPVQGTLQTSGETRAKILCIVKRGRIMPPILGGSSLDASSDPYVALEDLYGDDATDFALASNQACVNALGDPITSKTQTYKKILRALEANESGVIPFVSMVGRDDGGNEILYNLWKDKKHPKGIWRKTTMESFKSPENTDWTTVLDIGELSRREQIDWMWQASRILPRARSHVQEVNADLTSRVLMCLSNGSTSQIVLREFDLANESFISQEDGAFILPESRTSASYKSRDVLYVCSDYGMEKSTAFTGAGFPRTVREWKRGTDLKSAPVILEGKETDLTVSAHIDDQRIRGGGIYEVLTRTISLHSSKYMVRKIKYEHLLSDDEQKKADGGESILPEFREVQIPGDASIDFVGNLLVITLHSAWTPDPEKSQTFSSGSIVYVNAHKFVKYGPTDRIYHVLFEPSENGRVLPENYCVTRNFLVLSVSDHVKSRLEFYKLEKGANKLRLVATDHAPLIRIADVRAVDSFDGDLFWLTTTTYTEPTTLWLCDATKVDHDDRKQIRRVFPETYQDFKLASLPSLFDASDIEVFQRFAISKDGTSVPYFIIKKQSSDHMQDNPTLLYGHGCLDISVGPQNIAATGLAWLERGGIYVEANVRGGGEFGRDWHEAAMGSKRHKAQEDFVAVAEDLIASEYCKPRTLGIRSGSHGGFLVASMYNLRPDLFGAAHCSMPLLDMKRYATMQPCRGLSDEFGDPDSKDWENFMQSYSPYHNIDEEVRKKPPILFTSLREAEIHPGHARKMVKKLWELGRGKRWPVYYYEGAIDDKDARSEAKEYAKMAALAYDFMFSTLSKNAEKTP